jgi:alpha-amylase/alpha-mannosidase (GH57 family)
MSDESTASVGQDPRPAAAGGPRLKVVLCWHMHQPQYKDLIRGDYQLPWTYLHAVKDYTDMAAHLEAVPGARAVVNFAPILIEQIADYAAQVHDFLTNGGAIRDPLLAALAPSVLPGDDERRLALIKDCLRAQDERMIRRFPAYQRLAEMARLFVANPSTLAYLNEQFLADILVWYHLAWLGETVRRSDARVQALIAQESGYTLHDRRTLVEVIGSLLAGLNGRYARLAEKGQVELSITPYAHPIIPLLIDLGCAREAMPNATLPSFEQYPGGVERARWHIRRGIDTFRRFFGYAPAGCWPSEGAVSAPALKLLAEFGFAWAASGEGVLRASLVASGTPPEGGREHWLYRPYAVADSGVSCFFRDDGLSDKIGFSYATWHADDAVANLVHDLESIARASRGQDGRVVAIIMDGENAWEHYPENAYHFLSALYRRLVEHPQIALTTFSEYIEAHNAKRLPKLTAGSWVHGTLSTWIGDPDKNRGWEMLADAKRAFDEAIGSIGPPEREAAEIQLAVCEGSDWFWWFGDYNPTAAVSDFERLYRQHLTNLYQLICREPPEYLSHVFAHGHGAPTHGGTMRPGTEK